jgi:hypothetical protein
MALSRVHLYGSMPALGHDSKPSEPMALSEHVGMALSQGIYGSMPAHWYGSMPALGHGSKPSEPMALSEHVGMALSQGIYGSMPAQA